MELTEYKEFQAKGLDLTSWINNELKWVTIVPDNEKITLYIYKDTSKDNVLNMLKSLAENAHIVNLNYYI